ncbi:hypothetical protein GGR56DRAFT_350567 [Xylariaceae sp. FL0804]|nr:hypothetical protein GGR56DRAFT_350567 [Xylariaceae sp. FL0804]
MKATTAMIALAARAMAGSVLAGRDPALVTGMLNSVLSAMNNADGQLQAFVSGGASPMALRDAAHNLYQTIQTNTEQAQSVEYFSPEDAEAIGGLSKQVSQAGTGFLEDLAEAKMAFENAGICDYLYQYTVALYTVSNEYFKALGAKFPPEVQSQAAVGQVFTDDLFVETQQQLAPGSCVNKVEAPQMPQMSEGGQEAASPAQHEGAPTETSVEWETGNRTFVGGIPPHHVPIAGATAAGVTTGVLGLAAAAAGAVLML